MLSVGQKTVLYGDLIEVLEAVKYFLPDFDVIIQGSFRNPKRIPVLPVDKETIEVKGERVAIKYEVKNLDDLEKLEWYFEEVSEFLEPQGYQAIMFYEGTFEDYKRTIELLRAVMIFGDSDFDSEF
ncbi:MAG: hypothetical protein ACP5KD_09085 [Fervidobacterium sp.]